MNRVPTVHVISDSLGDTACEVVLAAAGQFDEGSFCISRLPHVCALSQVQGHLEPYIRAHVPCSVFYTIVDDALRTELACFFEERGISAVDLMGPAVRALSRLTGCAPKGIPGIIHRTDERYFRRIACMEYFVEHDDGRGADDLGQADIVIIGISRTSKTPLSMYLALQGYRVANIPLAPGMEPPPSLFTIDPARVFGLLSTTKVVSEIRAQRLGDDFTRGIAESYARPESVEREMSEARALMRRIGCYVVRTDGKSIEESAAEIVRQLELVDALRSSAAGPAATA